MSDIKKIQGGVTAPYGFYANGVHAGIRKNKDKLDLALIYSDALCAASAVYTKNLVKGAPLVVTKQHLSNGYAKAVICNSGNANTCNENGIEIAAMMCESVAKTMHINADDVVVASTGVIGQKLCIDPIYNAMPALCKGLSANGSDLAARAIMTTDTMKKEVAYEFSIDGVSCKIGGIAKGSGMINPNMATMLCFITTDVSITPALLNKALSDDISDTFNMISVDSDTSTNDMVAILANGHAFNSMIIDENDENFRIFKKALNAVTSELSKAVAKDGEGATKLITCKTINGNSEQVCKKVSKAVISSSLVKAAMFGNDANWGRVLCAAGYSGQDIDINKIDIYFSSLSGKIQVCKSGFSIVFDETLAKEILDNKEVEIILDLNDGKSCAVAYGCDLTYDYVKINGDYRT